jgi:hypothetical protein
VLLPVLYDWVEKKTKRWTAYPLPEPPLTTELYST